MAKAKKLPVLTDEELLAPLPAVANPVGTLSSPKCDFAAQKQFLEARINQVLSEEMTEQNLERVQKLKKGVVGWRTAFDRETKDYMKAAFKAPMDVYKAAAAEVLAEIDTIEAKLDEVLDKEEQKRRDNLNTMFDGMEEELQEEFNLPDSYKERIERKKNYYNKTAVMSEVAADLRNQYESLAKEYKNYQLAVKTINSLCKDDKRLNTQMYINRLETHELAEIMDEIEKEKERLSEIDAPKTVVEPEVVDRLPLEPEADGKIHIGVPDTKIPKSDFPGLTKTMTLEITYPVDAGDSLTNIFESLRQQGIKLKVLSCIENAATIPKF